MAARSAREHAAFLLPHLRAGARLLDCGCGPGVMTAELAALVAPGEAIGVDLSGAQFSIGKERAKQLGIGNLVLREGGVSSLPFDEGAFDLVFAHALLEHLVDPAAAVRELARVLVPGGLLGVCSPDWGGFIISPSTLLAAQALTAYEHVQAGNGGNPRVGRELAEHAAAAGLDLLEVTARYECYPDRAWIANYLAEHLDSAGAAEEARALRAWGPDAAMFAQAWVSVVARKPSP
jgi:SAM-dependent methyltransferase